MGEGFIQKYVSGFNLRLASALIGFGITLVIEYYSLQSFLPFNPLIDLAIMAVSAIILAILIATALTPSLTKPTRYLAQAILHISPTEHLVAAPDLKTLSLGSELIESLARQVYSYATAPPDNSGEREANTSALIDQLPVAIIGIDQTGTIKLANTKARQTLKTEQLIGQQFNYMLQFLTEDEQNLTSWLETISQSSLTGQKLWQKVELKNVNNESLGYFDAAVSFSKHSGTGLETVLVLFDHSDEYDSEEATISFIAMAVHEMRTPVTIFRGFLEAFEEELGTNASPLITDDLRKMRASAEGLSSFISNILNVARINEGQLTLKLKEDSWNQLLPQFIDTLRERASVNGKQIELRMQPDMPAVAVDRVTIGEVITNLIDNAIKYSPDTAPKITVISQVNSSGLVETTVQDQGVGIPSSVMPHLFSKFYRNHRNRSQIGGTGLGLFLSKAIITAHHGNIWASSKENEGSTFGFTLLPYDQLAKEDQNPDNDNIVRTTHGWIKNHSMQRR